MEPGGSMPHSPIVPIMNRINPIPRIDTYLFKIHSNTDSHLHLGLPEVLFPVDLPVNILNVFKFSSIWAT